MPDASSRRRIKEIIVESLNLEGMSPDEIGDEDPLWGDEGLGLDSVDALELMVALEKEYSFRIDNEEVDHAAMASVAHIDQFVQSLKERTESAA